MNECEFCGRPLPPSGVCDCRKKAAPPPANVQQAGFESGFNPFSSQAAENYSDEEKRGKMILAVLITVAVMLAIACFGVWFFLLRDTGEITVREAPDGGDMRTSAGNLKIAAGTAMKDISAAASVKLDGYVYIVTNGIDIKGDSLNRRIPAQLSDHMDEFYQKLLECDENVNYYAYVMVFNGTVCEYAAIADEFSSANIATYPAGESGFTIYTPEGAEEADKMMLRSLDDVYDHVLESVRSLS